MIPRVGYLINSTWGYSPALALLLESMNDIPRQNIIVVIGNAPYTRRDGHSWIVEHNSFDYTALIEFVQHRPTFPDHILVLQDTMVLRETTDQLARQVSEQAQATAAFGGQCNLATYRYDYLLGRKDDILKQKNITKHQSVEREGMLWKTAAYKEHYQNAYYEEDVGPWFPYGTSTPRIREFYHALHIEKFKANHGGSRGIFTTQL